MTRWHVYITEPDGDTSVYFCDEAPRFEYHGMFSFVPKNGPDPACKHTVMLSRLQRIVEKDNRP